MSSSVMYLRHTPHGGFVSGFFSPDGISHPALLWLPVEEAAPAELAR